MLPQTHLRIVRGFDALLAVIYLVTTLAIAWWIWNQASEALDLIEQNKPREVIEDYILIGCFVAAMSATLSIFYALTAWRVGRAKGRWLQTITAVLMLPAPPPFTLVGIYSLWVCWWNPSTRALFNDPSSMRGR